MEIATKDDVVRLESKLDSILNLMRSSHHEPDQLMTRVMVKSYLQWSEATFQRHYKKLPFRRIAGQYRIYKSELDEFIRNNQLI
jgi:hypothetical protein